MLNPFPVYVEAVNSHRFEHRNNVDITMLLFTIPYGNVDAIIKIQVGSTNYCEVFSIYGEAVISHRIKHGNNDVDKCQGSICIWKHCLSKSFTSVSLS